MAPDQWRRVGRLARRAQQQGDDRKSARIEAHAALILAEYQARSDITLAELKARLAACGANVGIGALWRFFDRRRITLDKRRRGWPDKIVLA